MKLSRGEALACLRQAKFTADSIAESWVCPIGPVTLTFPNFAWRRRAIAAHDLHHLITGYPMTMQGEFQMAAWEFGAGRYPHWGATLFCAPLILVGLLWSPKRMRAAYKAGRATKSLYSEIQTLEL